MNITTYCVELLYLDIFATFPPDMFCSFNSFCIASYPVDFMFHGRKVRVRGRFPLRNPWWEISCSAKQYARRIVIDGYPSYKLRTDLKNDWCTILALFLKECDVDPNFVTRFVDWLPMDRYVDLINVEEVLHEFGECMKETRAEADYVKHVISKSGISSMLLKCLFSSMVLYFHLCSIVKCFYYSLTIQFAMILLILLYQMQVFL